MNIVFFANGRFSIPSLESLINSKHKILRVVTNNDKKGGRGNKLISTPVAEYCIKNNIQLTRVDNIEDKNFIKKLHDINADIYIVISYKILPEQIFSIPKHGSINIHASVLPEYKGAAPIQRSIINGDNYIGLTAFKINSRIDSGEIINQLKININDSDNYGKIHDLLSIKSGDFLYKSLELLNKNKSYSYNIKTSSYAMKINKEEFKISLNENALNIHNLFRGLTPPGPHLLLNNKKVKLFDTYYSNINSHLIVGEWNVKDNILNIGCEKGILLAKFIQFEGKNKISIKDFNNMNLNSKIYFK